MKGLARGGRRWIGIKGKSKEAGKRPKERGKMAEREIKERQERKIERGRERDK